MKFLMFIFVFVPLICLGTEEDLNQEFQEVIKLIPDDVRPKYILVWEALSNTKETRARAILDKRRFLSKIKLDLSGAAHLNIPEGYDHKSWITLYERVNDWFALYGKIPDAKRNIAIYNVLWPKQCKEVKLTLSKFPSATLEQYMDMKGGNPPCMVVLSSNQTQTIEAITLYQYNLFLFGQENEIDVEIFSFDQWQ